MNNGIKRKRKHLSEDQRVKEYRNKSLSEGQNCIEEEYEQQNKDKKRNMSEEQRANIWKK